MRRRLLIALFAFGTIGGYAAGFASLRCHARRNHESFERHVAAVCVDAARGVRPPAPNDRLDFPR